MTLCHEGRLGLGAVYTVCLWCVAAAANFGCFWLPQPQRLSRRFYQLSVCGVWQQQQLQQRTLAAF